MVSPCPFIINRTAENLVKRYAVEKTDTYIKVFFWARNDASVPVGVRDGNGDVDTANWVCWTFAPYLRFLKPQ